MMTMKKRKNDESPRLVSDLLVLREFVAPRQKLSMFSSHLMSCTRCWNIFLPSYGSLPVTKSGNFSRWENAQPYVGVVGYIAPMRSWKMFEESNAPFKCLEDGLSCRSCWKHLKAGTTVTLVVVEVAAVLAICTLGSGGSDGNVDLLDGDLEDLAVLGDVLGGDDLASGAIGSVVKGRRGGDSGSGNLLVAGRGGLLGRNLLLAKVRAVRILAVLAVITEDGRGSLAEVAIGGLGSLGG